MSEHPLEQIFHPRAIAVVGVPSQGTSGRIGDFLGSLKAAGYHEQHGLYPVNPKTEEVAGLRCYPTLLDCPDPVDHVISQIPARAVPLLVEQCAEKGVRSLHLFTAGFSETGDAEMAALEREIVERARAAGVRVIGPNCMGLYVPAERLSFMGGFPTEPGHVLLLSQSGANASAVVGGLAQRGVRFSKAISFGNGADLQAHDFLDYAATDPETEVVTAYIEGVTEGRNFFEALKRCAAVKPTIILKGGIHPAGARAAHSHTGSLAGSIDIFEALCRQSGAIRATSMDDLHDLVIAVTTEVRRVAGRGVALVGGGGGIAVLSADAIATAGLDLPELPAETQRQLREFIPVAGTSVRNPIDINIGASDDMRRVYRIVAAAEPVDVIFGTSFGVGPSGPAGNQGRDGDAADDAGAAERAAERARQAADSFAELQEESGIPVVALQGGPQAGTFQQRAYERGVAVFPTVERAARAIGMLLEWRTRREGLPAIF